MESDFFCCVNCFEDFFLKRHIINCNNVNNCSFCNSTSVYCISPQYLEIFFVPLANLYTSINDFFPSEILKNGYNGEYLWEKLANEWMVFSDAILEVDNANALLKKILSIDFDETEYPGILEDFVEKEEDFHEGFARKYNLEKAWKEFSKELKSENRFFHSKGINKKIFLQLLQYLEIKMSVDKEYFRTRNSYRQDMFSPEEMGMSSPEKTKNGRANPIGIPYLYLASDQETAINEIRPSLGDTVTVGKFELLKELAVIDLRAVSPFQFVNDEDFDKLIKEIGFLYKLGQYLSKPINPRDIDLDYLPTQYVCEFIKQAGWHGVIYGSSRASGHNITLFSDKQVKCKGVSLRQVTKMQLEHKELKRIKS